MEPTFDEIVTFLSDTLAAHPANRGEDDLPYFDAPLVGVVDAFDPLLASYKTVIGNFHQTPAEAFAAELKEPLKKGSVISWSMPIIEATCKENAAEDRIPCRRWARTRDQGQQFIDQLTLEFVQWLSKRGVRAVVPRFEMRLDPRVGITSNWSERHTAFAAGLGTFSLNDALITERGIAHRLSSVVVDHPYPATPRKSDDLHANCLFLAKDTCGLCIKRCPAGAISKDGHDKMICKEYCYGTVMDEVAEDYGVTISGCGLCQTGVPCEARNPVR
jgi:epoxyqueuosine reductase QueG